jgi:uncharacterized membrane protein YcaP (DUF421 family)
MAASSLTPAVACARGGEAASFLAGAAFAAVIGLVKEAGMLDQVATVLAWLADLLDSVLGIGREDLTVGQMAARALVVYIAALAMVRFGYKRFMGRNAAFDLIIAIMLGSLVSRAITGQSPFTPTIAAGFVLIGLHWLFAWISMHWSRFGDLVKGESRLLVRDGEVDRNQMRAAGIGPGDLLEALRLRAGTNDLGSVREARLERSGDISFVHGADQPRIIEAKLEGSELRVTVEMRTARG